MNFNSSLNSQSNALTSSVSNAECNCTGINCSGKLPCARARHTTARAGLQPHVRCVHLAHCHARCVHLAHRSMRARHTGARAGLHPHARCVHLAQVHTRVRHVTCEPIQARHTVAPYWLTLVRRARHSRTHAPCAQPRVSHDCHVMRRITYHLVFATLVLHHACAVKIQRRLAATRSAKCAIKAPHCASSPTPRARASVCECECELGCSAPFARTLVCASMKQDGEILLKYPFKFHLSSYVGQSATSPLISAFKFQTPNFEHRYHKSS
ncbi:hypothetical protein Hanom_Chr03g00235291 [Helianthus anomalus]